MRNRIFNIIISAILLMYAIPVHAQKSNYQGLFSINGQPVPTEEFSYVFKKNNSNNGESYTREDIDEYLELFINFKLKVTEARALGYDTTTAYKDELDKYQDQLTKPYLSEKEVTRQLLEEAYERMKFEVDVSHILISVSPDAAPEDTLRAYKRIHEVWEKAIEGENFESLVLAYSQEPMTEVTKGHLGYFTSLQMVYPFENMAYNTPVGEVSAPFRTQFGYHILKVHDKRPSHGKVSVSHIMLRFKPSMTGEDSLQLRNRIFEVYEKLISGYDWDMLCKEVSEDLNSKERGGSLTAFGVGEMIPEIVEVAFSLSETGDISDPVMSPYGWHILKLNGITPLPSFEEYKNQLSRRIQRDTRSSKGKEVLIERLKREDGFVENSELKRQLFDSADSTTFSGKWHPDQTINLTETLFSLTDSTYSMEDFIVFINQNTSKSGTGHPSIRINRLFNLFVEDRIIAYEKAHLEEKYEDYRYLLKEYREGILLFDIMEKEVWTKSGQDSVGLTEFYENNLNSYKVIENASLITFEVINKEEVRKLIDRLTLFAGDTTSSLNTVKEKVANEFPDVIVKSMGHFIVGDVEWSEFAEEGPGVYDIETATGDEVIFVRDYHPGTIPELDQIRGVIISDYQDYLDKQWIDYLRSKYSVKVNKNELKKLYNSLAR